MNKLTSLIFFLTVVFSSITVSAQSIPKPNPKALEAMTKGNFKGAIGILDADIRDEKNLFDSYKLRSDLKKMTGDFPGALADLNKAIELRIDDATLYERRAELRMIVNPDMTQVLNDLDSAISYGTRHERVFSLRAMIRSNTGDLDGSISDYETAIGLRPNYAQAYIGLSSVYMRQKQDAKAIETLENFITSIENSDSKPSAVKGQLAASNTVDVPIRPNGQVKLAQNSVVIVGESRSGGPPSPDEMVKGLDGLEQSKNTALAYINLASLYEKGGDHERALTTVEKGINMDRTDFYGFEVRGKIRSSLGDYAGAVSDLGASISMAPKMAGNKYLERGIAYLMLGKDNEAQVDFENYLLAFPKGKTEMDRRIEEARKKKQQQ